VNIGFDVIQALVFPTKVLRVSNKISYIRGGLATPPQTVSAHSLRQYDQQSTLYYYYRASIHGVTHFMPRDGMLPCHLPKAK
jgi:hypothetical protein